MRLQFDFRGFDELRGRLGRAVDGLEDFRVPLERCGIEMYKSLDKNFQSGGRPNRWPPHAPLTRKLRPGGRMLMDSGQLRQSVTSKTGQGAKYRLSKDTLIIGSNIRARGSSKLLAEILQKGQPAGVHKVFGRPSRRGMPGRPFLLIHDEDVATFERIFTEYIRNVLR